MAGVKNGSAISTPKGNPNLNTQTFHCEEDICVHEVLFVNIESPLCIFTILWAGLPCD